MLETEKSLLDYLDERMKVLNTMRAFADREGKLAFDNMIHELAQVRVKVERLIVEIDRHTIEAPSPFAYVLKRDLVRMLQKTEQSRV